MSGISLAASQPLKPQGGNQSPAAPGGVNNVSFLQIQLMAYIVVFTVSGLVPAEEFGCAVFFSIYAVGLSIWVFPAPSKTRPPGLFNVHRWFPAYVAVGSVIGLFLPLAYVLGGFARGDTVAAKGATPSLFLLACQLLTENIIVEINWISLPVRAIVPLLYTARRLVTILAWTRGLFESQEMKDISLLDPWAGFGRLLALANLCFWSSNLVLFIIPMFLPRAFAKYFEMQQAAQQGKPIPSEAAPQQAGAEKPQDKKEPPSAMHGTGHSFDGDIKSKVV